MPAAPPSSESRRLLLRDTLSILILILITAAMFTATFFLFRAFSRHRAVIAERWLERAREATAAGRPAEAAEAFRSALAYAPSDRQRQLETRLAEALAAAGRGEEAANYFENLWERAPGDGNLNLQLARLAARSGQDASAIEHYLASIYGSWPGDGSIRRREVRLELIRFLLATDRTAQAVEQLRIAAGNAPPPDTAADLETLYTLGSLFEQAGSPAGALDIYRSILVRRPRDTAALLGAARAEYALGYLLAARDHLRAAMRPDHPLDERSSRLLASAARAVSLYPSPDLSPAERAGRIRAIAGFASKRLEACLAEPGQGADAGQRLAALGQQWSGLPARLSPRRLAADPGLAERLLALSYRTELALPASCAPAPEDSAIEKIARAPEKVEAR